jgi:hypothetical protein
MPYPVLPAGRYGSGTPIDIADGNKLWRGQDRTNGFLMRSVDGRIPALEESFSRLVAGATNPLYDDGVIPWGNAVWLNLANMKSSPHTVIAEKPAAAKLAGVLKFEQGWQTGNAVQPWGLPIYSRGTLIRDGLVGYKVAMKSGGDPDDYLACMKGDDSKDVPAVRTVYDDWVTAMQSMASTDLLCLFFDNLSGFPIVAVVGTTKSVLAGAPGSSYAVGDFSQAVVKVDPQLAGATFGGVAKVFEPENQAIYFEINT